MPDTPLGNDMRNYDDQLQEAIKQSLQQYNIDLERQACGLSTDELR